MTYILTDQEKKREEDKERNWKCTPLRQFYRSSLCLPTHLSIHPPIHSSNFSSYWRVFYSSLYNLFCYFLWYPVISHYLQILSFHIHPLAKIYLQSLYQYFWHFYGHSQMCTAWQKIWMSRCLCSQLWLNKVTLCFLVLSLILREQVSFLCLFCAKVLHFCMFLNWFCCL